MSVSGASPALSSASSSSSATGTETRETMAAVTVTSEPAAFTAEATPPHNNDRDIKSDTKIKPIDVLTAIHPLTMLPVGLPSTGLAIEYTQGSASCP